MTSPDRPTILFTDPESFRAWLDANHATCDGVWAKFAKKGASLPPIDYVTALKHALCYGWIDGQRKAYDDEFYLQAWTPRRPRSPWSLRNVGFVEELIADGLMMPAGHAEIDRAKADGRWDRAYGGQSKFELPQDFLDELAANPSAAEFFATLTKQDHFSVYYRLQEAKKPETRARRITKFVATFADRKKLP